MATGSGLPIPKSNTVLSQAPTMSADSVSSAAAWTKIASAGEKIADSATDLLAKDVHLQQAGAVADFENEWRDKNVEARDQYAKDPEGFKTWAQSSVDGAVSSVPAWMAPHAKSYLTRTFDGSYSAILSERRSQDDRVAGQAIDARRKGADDDVMGLAAAGKLNTAEGNAAVAVHSSVLDTAVQTKRIAPEMADYLREDLAGRAYGEVAARQATQVYREKGFDAAVDYLNKNIRENDSLQLKQSQRDKAFNRGLSQIRLAQAQDKDDRTDVIEISKDVRQRLISNQPVDPNEISQTLAHLERTGAAAEFHRLSVEAAVRQQTEAYRTGLDLRGFAGAVASNRGQAALQAANTQTAMQFFQSRGYTPVQAAGIVGNLVQESGPLDPTLSHDNGTGVGIAGWRLERRQALRTFAAAKGTGETDFQTQLEFLDQELRTTESGAGGRLKAAQTPAQAAEAMIHFERPQGYSESNPRAGHGFANRVANAEALAGQPSQGGAGGVPGVPYAGEVARRVQTVFVGQARTAWPQFKARIDKGETLDLEDLTSIRYAAALSGDANWQREVEAATTAQKVGASMSELPAAERSAGQLQVKEELQKLGLPVIDQQSINDSLEKQFERQNKEARENPVGYWVDRGGKAPDPLDLSSPASAAVGAKDRYSVARLVAMREGIPPGVALQPAERQSVAAAIRTGNADQAAAGFEVLHSAPDDMLVGTLKSDEIKAAVVGAAHSNDPARFLSAMSALDRLYQRAPEDVAAIYGGDVFKNLQDWQAKLRYSSPAELADTLKRRDDPQVRERQKFNIEAGEKIAREKKPDSLIGEWQSAFGLFGAGAPVDPRTRDAWMQDYTNLFGERYATSLDKDVAHRQAVERMKVYWQKSGVNGGRLTLYPPETTYSPDAKGSYDWMRNDLEADIKARTGKAPSDYTVIADPTTEREVTARQPASYLVSVKNDQTGEWDVLRGADMRPQRYRWDASKTKQDAREQFQRQRERILSMPQPSMADYAPGG
jgi:hypothetical protein